ncbi:lipocalin family protein [Marivirga harenae]|uniref:lipocalin family protein n=1 Tax=Marivirga harenae TaxID=2010992 RepID=UPI0026DFB92B|nr:lipocalin family protein [Marivirga harenae]WKV11050.1 lipocalin family protein [Marivirga harenae]|tara:strand:- start:141142 stop:141612 length:471 start_codon:yes stop_codon:yes gene_type:complete
MKNFKLLVVLFIGLFILQGCNKEDDENLSNTADLIGLWTSTEVEITFLVDGQPYTDNDLAPQFEGQGQTLVFREDNTFTSNEGTADEDKGTWSLNAEGSIITFNSDSGESYEYEILSSSDSQLKIKYEQDITALAAFFGVEVQEEFILEGEVILVK